MFARRSSSVQRGSELSARKPLASTSPSAEFCSSCFTTSGTGTELRDTARASSSSRGGAILLVLRLMKRSMTSASARMEQATRGQIGQPAACMIESKGTFLRACVYVYVLPKVRADYRVRREAVGGKRIAVGLDPQKLWTTLLRSLRAPRANPRHC